MKYFHFFSAGSSASNCHLITFCVLNRRGEVNFFSMLGWRLVIIVLSILGFTEVKSQGFTEPPPLSYTVVVPPAPTAAALARYGAYEVNMASGVPNISIPLFDIKRGSLSLPISLSYHAAGNRVEEIPSWVGLGWSLNAGGVITRTMQGNPDEDAEKGFLQTAQWLQSKETLTNSDYQAAKDVAQGFSDTTPDVFSFNFAGYSGKFYLDFDGNAHLVPYQPLKIISDLSSAQSPGFIIITEDGTRYIFQEEEKSDYQFGHLFFTSSWYLSEVQSADQNDIIQFFYGSHRVEYELQENVAKLYEYSGLDIVPSQRAISRSAEVVTVPNSKKLVSIDFGEGVLGFSWTASNDKEAQLNAITMKSAVDNQVVRAVNLEYSLFPKRNDCQSDECDRRRLDRVGINDEEFHDFTYDDQPFPPFDSYDRDHWGYYNNADNSSPIPTYTTYYNESAGDGANRLPDASAMSIGILKEIRYPTGGVTKFDFEPNEFYYFDQPGGNEREIEMPITYRLEVTQENTHVLTQDFAWPGPVLPLDPDVGLEDITWQAATKYFVEFGTVPATFNSGYNSSPKFQLFDGSGFNETVSLGSLNANHYDPMRDIYVTTFEGMMFTSPDVSHTARLQTGDDVGNYVRVTLTAKGSYEASEPGADGGHIIVGGLRVKSIRNYSVDGDYLTGKEYSYEKFPEVSSGRLLTGSWEQYRSHVLLYMEGYSYEFGCFDPANNRTKLVLHDNPVSQVGGAPVIMYEKVRETITGETDAVNGYIESSYEIWLDDPRHMVYPHPPRIDDGWRRGQIASRKYYKNVPNSTSFQLVREEAFTYALSEAFNSLWAAKITFNRRFNVDEYVNGSGTLGGGCPDEEWIGDINEMAWIFYQLESRWKYLMQHVILDYRGGEVITKTLDYAYTPGPIRLLRSKTTTIHGDIKSEREETIYPFDIPNTNTMLYSMASNMTNSHAISLPVERRVLEVSTEDERVIDSELIQYEAFKPHKVYSLKPDVMVTDFEGAEVSASMDSRYGAPDYVLNYSGGRISRQMRRDDVALKYLWNDGFNVSCKAVVPNEGTVAFTSFEEQALAGGWSGTSLTRQAGNAQTGEWYGVLGVGSELTCLATSNTSYRLTFWVKGNASLSVEAGGILLQVTMIEELGQWKLYEAGFDAPANDVELTIAGSAIIDELRLHPLGAEMTTFTYEPLVGVSSITDLNNNSVYYEYDENNRLKEVSDRDRNIEQLLNYRLKIDSTD